MKIIQKSNRAAEVTEAGTPENKSTAEEARAIWIINLTFADILKRSSRRPSRPMTPAIAVNETLFKTNNPITMNDTHIPIPPPRGVGSAWELRSLGSSMRKSLLPYLEIKAAQIALRVKDRNTTKVRSFIIISVLPASARVFPDIHVPLIPL